MKNIFIFNVLTVILLSFSACNRTEPVRIRLSLAGEWMILLDEDRTENSERWKTELFEESVYLPGTTDLAGKGMLNSPGNETNALSRNYMYTGKAWYKKSVNIPADWKDKEITLFLERTKPTHIWIDGQFAGTNDNISTPQEFTLTSVLTPGEHEVIIMVDNGQSVPRQILTSSHAYTEATQTNWNGIIGDIFLEARNPAHLVSVEVTPSVHRKSAIVKITLSDASLSSSATWIELSATSWNSDKRHTAKKMKYTIGAGVKEYTFEYHLGEDALLWSEFDPALYALDVVYSDQDTQTVNFGLRDFATEGTQFTINGIKTFLRGKHDACVFPLTAHTPMDIESWRRYFQICKSYGINHCRFHSWCPPKACFDAADIEGIYLQPELPFWGSLRKENEELNTFLLKEGINIQKAYSNHASFVLFALGNELSGELEIMQQFTQTFRETDDRHLYAYGSNNYLGFKGQLPGEDFLVTCRIGGAPEKQFTTHTRGSFSFADAWDGGYINHCYPNTQQDFSGAIDSCTVPVISHETGQFQVYPNFREMGKYTGALRPDNFAVFKERLMKAGMADQADDFFKASGRWAAMLYKADIEMCLRTAGLGGFQLLDLQDYPGQGSAYVGILDAFMDSKGLVSADEWKGFCDEVVPLFIAEKYVWTMGEKLQGEIKVANYSPASLKGSKVIWKLMNKDGKPVDQGEIQIQSDEQGLLNIGKISPDISSVRTAEYLSLCLSVENKVFPNIYPVWIYPGQDAETPSDVYITNTLSAISLEKLGSGEKVLWIPERKELENLTVGGLFQTDYWNYRMFKSICDRIGKPASPGTLGLFTNPEHPVFNDFPTDYHTNWQWFSIIKESFPFILDRMPANYKPIVQVIDNVERNHKLGLLFEFSVGGGKLLVCMSDLRKIMDKPEVKQFYTSLLNYMNSPEFHPETQLDISALRNLFSGQVERGEIKILNNISYE